MGLDASYANTISKEAGIKSRYAVLFRNNDRRSTPIMNQLIRHLVTSLQERTQQYAKKMQMPRT